MKGKWISVEIPQLLALYHVTWSWSNGVVGKCISIDYENKTVILRNPKTKKNWKNPVKWSDLRYTRRQQHKAYEEKKTSVENNQKS